MRRFHDTLGDGRVDVLLKPGLCARELPQLASGGPRVMVLQCLASLGKALPFPFDLGAAIDSAIRIDRQVDNAKISFTVARARELLSLPATTFPLGIIVRNFWALRIMLHDPCGGQLVIGGDQNGFRQNRKFS